MYINLHINHGRNLQKFDPHEIKQLYFTVLIDIYNNKHKHTL